MKVYDRLKNSFLNSDYYLSFSKDYIYILNYQEIILLTNNKIIIKLISFNIIICGDNFIIKRKSKTELLINGKFSKMEIENEI